MPRRWFHAIDKQQEGTISAKDLSIWTIEFYSDLKRLWRALAGRFGLVAVTNTLVSIAAVIVSIIAILAVWEIPSSTYLVPIGSAVLALSFAYGQSVQDLTYALYLVFGVRPYEVGDWVSLDDGRRMVVREVRMMTTVFSEIPTSRLIYIANSKIYSAQIHNWTRTRKFAIRFNVFIDSWVTLEDVVFCRTALAKFVADSKGLLAKSGSIFEVANDGQVLNGQVQILVQIRLRHHVRYSEPEKWRPLNTSLTMFVVKTLRERNLNPKVVNGWLDTHYDMNAYTEPKPANWISPFEQEASEKKNN